MNFKSTSIIRLTGQVWLAMVLGMSVAETKSAEPPAKPAAASQVSSDELIPKSVFLIPASAAQGRNPFFPNSTYLSPAPTITSNSAPVEPAVLVLNGITGPPKRMAMINGKTMEPGEEGEVRLPSGSKILVKCVEVLDKSVIIEVGGRRRELKLRED